MVVLLLVIGTLGDRWRAAHPERVALPATAEHAPPAEDARAGPAATPGRAPSGDAPAETVDLNTAGVRELDALPGIGPVLAERIVEHRRAHGPFRTTDELLAVRGIGPRLFERLRPRVRAGASAAGAASGGAAAP